MNPGADARVIAIEDVMRCMKLILRGVIVVRAPARPHDGQIIDHATDVRPPITHLNTARPPRLEANLQRIQLGHQLPRPARKVPDVNGDLSTCWATGDSSTVMPAYLLSAGLGSNDSMWLTPPAMNNQITFFALASK